MENDRCNAEAAVQDTIEEAARALEDLDDDLLSQRVADLRDVGNRVIRILGGQEGQVGPRLSQPSILIASDPTPSDVAQLNPDLVAGLCTARGGTTSHAAILARAQGLPTVVGLGDSILSIADGTTLLVDGIQGEVQVEPAPAVVRECRERQAVVQAETARANALASQPAITRDGHQVEVAANISNVAEASQALECGAEGVGVLRTEFLYLDRTAPPDEDEQAAAYAEIARALGERLLIVRTLDIGGDKPAPYLEMPPELNPFLGRRAIRLCLERPALFKTQLRAILRAGAAGNVKMMFPMIATVEEVRQTKSLVEEARRELAVAGMAHAATMDVGIMVETPAAAVIADRLAEEVDFFSIGANDLVQYTVAVDRTNPLVAGLLDPLHPAVLRLIATVVEAAHAAGRWVGVCGEMAGQPTAIPLLVGLDVDELSMSPVAIPRAKQVIRSLDYAKTRTMAQEALAQDTSAAVRALADRALAK
jgi:phosphoenolpyruvate-protein phosphotransferase